jgi:two-component system chemotaxis response regulator CheY
MIVDDVAFVRRTLSELFTEAHYQVIGEASSGLEAVQMYQSLRPDLVTMDIVMPKLSGLEATSRILKINPKARILIVSAMDQMSLVMEAIHVGAKDYVLKPFSSRDVLKVVERVLEEGSSSVVSGMSSEAV